MNKDSISFSRVVAFFRKSIFKTKFYVFSEVLLLVIIMAAVIYSEPSFLKEPETCAICHEEIYNDWSESTHAWSWKSPVFQGQRTEGYLLLPFDGESCMHCWSPVSPLETPDEPIDGSMVSSLAEQGVQCIFCHGSDISSGIKEAEAFPIMMHMLRFPSAKLISNRDFLSSSEFCGNCHGTQYQVFLTTSFKEKGLDCQDCHMNEFPGEPVLNQSTFTQNVDNESKKVYHRFAGSKLYHSEYREYDQLREQQLKFLYSAMKINIVEPEKVMTGEPLELIVALSNVGSPHNFPEGRPPGKEAWVELIVRDKDENVFSHTGEPQYNLRDLEDKTVLRRIYIPYETGEAEGKYWQVLRGNVERINYFVPPDTTIHQVFTVPIPENAAFPISITANLRYKSLMQEYADHYMDKPGYVVSAVIIASDKREFSGISELSEAIGNRKAESLQ